MDRGAARGDALQLQREALDLVASFPGARRNIGPNQAEALLRIDARIASLIVKLTAQYSANYQRSTGVETRLWHGVFDLVKAFIAAYQATLKAGMVGARRAGRPSFLGFWCDLRTTGASTASFGCFATVTGFRRNGAICTSSTRWRACAAGSASRSLCRMRARVPPRSPSSANTSRGCCSCAWTAAASPPTRSNGCRGRWKSGSTR